MQDDGEGELVLDELEDGFHRLIAHGLAEYHSLSSHSRPLPGGGKVVVVRRRSVAGGPSAATATAGGSSGGAAAGGGDAAAGDAEADALVDVAEGVLVIRCADICHLLEDERVPLTPAVLSSAYLHSLDSASEAGDHPERQPGTQPAQPMVLAAS